MRVDADRLRRDFTCSRLSAPARTAESTGLRFRPPTSMLEPFLQRAADAGLATAVDAQYLTLQAVDEGEVVGAELARRAAVSPAAVSQLLATLEENGLLSRSRVEDDRRRQPLTLTEQGQSALRSAQTALRERLAGLLADMPPHEGRRRGLRLEYATFGWNVVGSVFVLAAAAPARSVALAGSGLDSLIEIVVSLVVFSDKLEPSIPLLTIGLAHKSRARIEPAVAVSTSASVRAPGLHSSKGAAKVVGDGRSRA